MPISLLSLICTLFTVVTAAPHLLLNPTSTTKYLPCATVSSLAAAATVADPANYAKIPAQIAWDCLQSVPLNASAGIPWVRSLRPYINWQTTTTYLKNPPAGYLQAPLDIHAELDQIVSNLQTDYYANEYDFEFELYRLFSLAYDGHFTYIPLLVADVFLFGRPLALVSVSADGYDLPKPFVYADILLSLKDDTFIPSAIATINGQDAGWYLEAWSQYGVLQDPDALYNNVFLSLAQVSLGTTGVGAGTFSGAGRGAVHYLNATTKLSFENGTTAMFENFARVLKSFDGIQTGQDVYDMYIAHTLDEFVQPAAPSSTSGSSGTPTPTSTSTLTQPLSTTLTSTSTPAPAYPSPVIRQENNLIGGYYLSGEGYEDVAVLSVPNFVSLDVAEESFQNVAFEFIGRSKADGNTKLIIDVSANGGGTILQAYSLFTNLFPHLVPYGATRFRAHESFDIIGEEMTAIATNVSDASVLDGTFLSTPFDYRSDVDVDYQNFHSWSQKYGPHEFDGDNFTSIIRFNLSDPNTNASSGIVVNGYQSRTNIVPETPFAPENIVIVYDGYCASTCAIFSELMTAQAGIQTIALGGRPFYGPMQAVGGVKGTNIWRWDYIFQLVTDTLGFGTVEQQAAWMETEFGQYSTLPFDRAVEGGYSVNVRDGIAPGDETETPLQFVYQAADCRIFYTADMTVDVTAIWKTVADTAWGGKSSCVTGTVAASGSVGGVKRARAKKIGRRALSSHEVSELEASMLLWTDLRGKTAVGDAYMLP